MTHATLRTLSLTLGSLCAASTAHGQNIGLTAPTAGYVFNPATSALHPIAGLPGASLLAAPVLSGVLSASFSPDADSAVVAKSDGIFLVTNVRTAIPQYQPLAPPNPYLAAWGKSTAILYADGKYQLLSRSGDSTALNPGVPPGTVTAIDYDEPAQRLYIALAADSEDAGLYVYSIAQAGLRHLMTLANPIAIARANSTNFVLDGATSAIWALTEGQAPIQLPGPTDPDTRFVAIAVSADASRLYAADAGLRQVLVSGLDGAFISRIQASTTPAKLERLGNSPLLLVSNEPGQPVWLLNDTSTPAVFFIPALSH